MFPSIPTPCFTLFSMHVYRDSYIYRFFYLVYIRPYSWSHIYNRQSMHWAIYYACRWWSLVKRENKMNPKGGCWRSWMMKQSSSSLAEYATWMLLFILDLSPFLLKFIACRKKEGKKTMKCICWHNEVCYGERLMA